jgi:hypothetical protein
MNYKKRTKLKRNTVLASVLVYAFVLFGCAQPITSPTNVPPPPPKTESVVPQLKKVSDGIDTVIKSNQNIDKKIGEQKKEITDQQIAIVEVITEAEKIKEGLKNPDTAVIDATLSLHIENLKVVKARNLFIEKQNSDLNELTKNQEKILKETRENASITQQKLLAKESEADNLRAQNNFLGLSLGKKNDEVTQLQSQLTKEKQKSAKADVYRKWVIGLAVGFIAWTIIKNILMIYFPIAKFRI